MTVMYDVFNKRVYYYYYSFFDLLKEDENNCRNGPVCEIAIECGTPGKVLNRWTYVVFKWELGIKADEKDKLS